MSTSCDNIHQKTSSSSSGRREPQPEAVVVTVAVTGRERLKRVREEVAGRVQVPDKWSHEELLRDWMDFSSFNALLAPKGIGLARQALMSEGRRGGSRRMRIC